MAAALFVLYTVLSFAINDIPDRAYLGWDCWEYQSMAVNFARGYGLKHGGILPIEEYAFDRPEESPNLATFLEYGRHGGRSKFCRTPAYPFVLGLIYKVIGVNPKAAMAMQLLWLVLIAALLPLLGDAVAGTRGFVAGVVGGLVFLLEADEWALYILTESLIAVACFVVLVTWVYMNRRGQSPARAALFGLALAFAMLVKGSLFLLPPLFLAYMIVRHVTAKAYGRVAIGACLLSLAAPVLAYSAYASVKTGAFVFVSTQGDVALLGGNNEGTLVSGGWNPQWREDPDSFHYKARKADPDRSAVSLVIGFYLSRPLAIPRIVINKLGASFSGVFTTVAFAVLCFLYCAVLLIQIAIRNEKWRYAATVLLLGVLILLRRGFITHLFAWSLVVAAGCFSASFRSHVAAFWRDPARTGMAVVMLNFLLIVLIFFGEQRYVAPAYFVFSFAGALLAIRLVERIEYLPGRYVGRGGPD